MNTQWQSSFFALFFAATLATQAFSAPVADKAKPAQKQNTSSSTRMGGFGFASLLERTVGLTPEQRDAVRGLLAQQREKSQALRQETDTKIRALLNADQQKKFDAMLAEQKARRASRISRAS
jgi:Spy/CpxP family protein refolding chaperone